MFKSYLKDNRAEVNIGMMIMLGVGVLITIGIVVAVMSIYNTSMSTTNKAQAELSTSTAALEDSKFTQYEGQTVKGGSVLTLAKQWADNGAVVLIGTRGDIKGSKFANYGAIVNSAKDASEDTDTRSKVNLLEVSGGKFLSKGGKDTDITGDDFSIVKGANRYRIKMKVDDTIGDVKVERKIDALSKKGSGHLVSPSATFAFYVIVDESDNVVGGAFEQLER